MNGKQKDLYPLIGVEILKGDKVKFTLNSGLETITSEAFESINIDTHKKSKTRKTLTGVIVQYKEDVRGDYEIRGYATNGYAFRLRLSNCYDLERIKPL